MVYWKSEPAPKLPKSDVSLRRLIRSRDAKPSTDVDVSYVAKVSCLAEIASESVDWLWGDVIPSGKVTTITGDAGVGKALPIRRRATASRSAIGRYELHLTECHLNSIYFIENKRASNADKAKEVIGRWQSDWSLVPEDVAETDKYKLMAHESFASQLIQLGVPNEFWTTSPVCILRNAWDGADHINQAIEDRGLVVHFDPTWEEVYKYTGEWFWDQEIYDYLLEKMPLLREPSIRPIMKAYNMKLANSIIVDWRTMIDAHIADKSHLLVSQFLTAEYRTEAKRITAWIKAVKAADLNAPASKATWHRYLEKMDDMARGSGRPERIVLTRIAPPSEFRPSDSPIGWKSDEDKEEVNEAEEE